MNTQRSQKKADAFLENGPNLKRKTLFIEHTFPHPPDKVFTQLCPTREFDWIEGWDCDLVYTTSGYVEKDCIFSTPQTSPLGPGLWILTCHEPDERLELVRLVNGCMVIHFRIELSAKPNGGCRGQWRVTHTALNQAGNEMVESLDPASPELWRAIHGLEHFLNTGELIQTTEQPA